jgi:putative drug exporter of the RND superfamily
MKSVLARIATFPANRRGKWVVLAAWILILVLVFPLASKFESAQSNEPSSFLPGSAESVAVLDLQEQFPGGDVTPAVGVAQRASGLSPEDRTAISRVVSAYNADLPAGMRPPGLVTGAVSPDGTTQLLIADLSVGGDSDLLLAQVSDLRDALAAAAPPGLQVAVTGPAGISADAIEVFGGINSSLLLAATLLVFVLLLIIYRSPVFWILPLLAVGFAEITVRGLGYLIADAGVVVNGQSAGILLVLVFGSGTDYALLLTARYREELRRNEDRHAAMAIAIRRAGPAILASAGTVIAALLVLVLAEVNGTAGLGPIAAMGVAVAMIVMLTALPALLLLGGRRAFWPFVPRYGSTGSSETQGWWRRLGERVARRPRATWITTALILAVAAVGLVSYNATLTSADDFRSEVQSVQGQEMINRAFPAGASAPTNVVVPPGAPEAAVVAAVTGTPGVSSVRKAAQGPPGTQYDVTLSDPPFSGAAYDVIAALRVNGKAAGGEGVLVGGPTATEADLNAASSRDLRLLVPIVLVVVVVILALLLRAVTAPAVLIATVVLSFLASLGIASVAFDLAGFAGESPALPLFGFIFLVALGVDYNIFLMARVREETVVHGTREGMLRGLAVTGGVITSAGIVLAGTFAVLGVLPLVSITQIGFLVAFGVLLDALVVRSLLVPAIVLDLGERTWWPSALSRRRP